MKAAAGVKNGENICCLGSLGMIGMHGRFNS
jgi:hypothetical protein